MDIVIPIYLPPPHIYGGGAGGFIKTGWEGWTHLLFSQVCIIHIMLVNEVSIHVANATTTQVWKYIAPQSSLSVCQQCFNTIGLHKLEERIDKNKSISSQT